MNLATCLRRLCPSLIFFGLLLPGGVPSVLGQSVTGESDWPCFLGPSEIGLVSTDRLPTRWNAEEGVVWYQQIPGLGWSSPIVVGGRIYLTAAIEGEKDEPTQLVAMALDGNGGEVVWQKVIFDQMADAPAIHSKNSHASPTPVSDGKRLYVHFGHQGTACLSLDGEILWTNQLHRYLPRHGNGSSPVLVDDLLVMTCDGEDQAFTLALRAADGSVAWKSPRSVEAERKFSFSTPTVIQIEGSRLLLSSGSDVIEALRPDTGELVWSVRYSGYSLVARPIYHGGLVLVPTGYDRPELLAIDPTGRGDVTETHVRWRSKSNVPNTPCLVPRDGQLLMISDRGIATCLDVTNGEEVWRQRIGGNYSASPLRHGDTVYLQSEEGESVVARWTDTGLDELSRNPLSGRIFASYAVIGDDLLIRSESGIYRIGQP
ncbi:MAG: PQQ-binding-like beta-propeller repeat protein [Pirellulaceae bacterium]